MLRSCLPVKKLACGDFEIIYTCLDVTTIYFGTVCACLKNWLL